MKVVWKIDIDATDPIEAAKKAQEIQLDIESTATIFEVTDTQTNETSVVDLWESKCEKNSDGIDLKEAQSIAEEILRVIAENQDFPMVKHFMKLIGAELDLTDAAILEAWETIEQERYCPDMVNEHPKERTWNTWILSESDIQEVAKQNELSLEGRDLDEIARQYERGISAMLGNGAPDWTDILKEAIQNTEPDGLC